MSGTVHLSALLATSDGTHRQPKKSGGEVARYMGRHGTDRVKKAVLVASVPPLMLKTDSNPNGVPLEVFGGLRQASLDNRSQLYLDIASGPFFSFNRSGSTPSQGLIQSFWVQGMQAGHKNTYDSIAAFSATDFRADLQSGLPSLGRPRLYAWLAGPSARNALYASWRCSHDSVTVRLFQL